VSAVSATGGCLCGAVRYRAPRASLQGIVICHCGQCRRFHGHCGAYASVPRDCLEFDRQEQLRWYRSSARARRGFCAQCGASLFWDPNDSDRIAVAAGSLDDAGELRVTCHIYTADAGGYYEIAPGLPQHRQGLPRQSS